MHSVVKHNLGDKSHYQTTGFMEIVSQLVFHYIKHVFGYRETNWTLNVSYYILHGVDYLVTS